MVVPSLTANERSDAADALLLVCREVHGRVLNLVGEEVRVPHTHIHTHGAFGECECGH